MFLKINSVNSFEYNTKLNLPNEFYTNVLSTGKDYFEVDSKYYLGQVFTENKQKYLVIVAARDRRGKTTTVYIVKILLFGGIGFVLLAFFLGRFLAKRVIDPVARITKEVKRISASNLHNRLPEVKNADEILNEFYNWRLKFYDKRKELILNKLSDNIKFILNQIKFINLVIMENYKLFHKLILNLNIKLIKELYFK